MIRLDADGNRYSDQYCLRCDMAPPHYALGWGGQNNFQCERCKSPIGDQDESGLGSTWLPGDGG
jgi:hypothetical protein